MSTQTAQASTKYLRTALLLVIVALAFVASYQIAAAIGSDSTAGAGSAPGTNGLIPALASNSTGSDSGLPCACCGGGANAEPVEGAAVLESDVQRITVDTSAGYYNPNIIKLAAGVPAEITFTAASGCLGEVQSADLNFYADLTSGDQIVRLEADTLQPGTYEFSCGMQMVFGTIIVE